MELLKLHRIELLIDVRSKPRSRFNPHFNKGRLEKLLWESGLEYRYFGEALGGHPQAEEFYDSEGHVVYERISVKRVFRLAIREVIDLSAPTRLAIMCAEEDPSECHRHPLLARALHEQSVRVFHIRKDGTLQEAATMDMPRTDLQLPLFELPGEDSSWRSPKRVR